MGTILLKCLRPGTSLGLKFKHGTAVLDESILYGMGASALGALPLAICLDLALVDVTDEMRDIFFILDKF